MDSLTSCFVIMFTCLFLLSSSLVQGSPKSNATDRAALLEFRSRISNYPDGIFSSWNDTIDFCHWPGITCGRRHPRVTKIELPDSRLGGSLSPYIGNLSFLRMIDIDNNGFIGEIPPEIGNLRRLTMLRLENNSFSGPLPKNISSCTKLRSIGLENSMLVGEIPRGLAALSELRFFRIRNNNFTGKFPHFIGNFSSLVGLDGSLNNFDGTIPASLGQLQKLRWLYLFSNFFSGNATNLQILQLLDNNFSGPVPNLRNLNQLQVLSISSNQLDSGTSSDSTFMDSLNSTELRVLAFNHNNFRGTLPESIGNLSANLNILMFAANRLTGTIPLTIRNLRNLEALFTDKNPLTGSLPGEIGILHKLKHLQAQYNGFSGEIPSSLGNLTALTKLFLAGNKLRGSIPPSLGKCQNLIVLDLSQNNLSGTIPSQILGIPSLTVGLDLSYNKLTGALPDEIGDLSNIEQLYVQENRLSGQVPNTLSRCTSLEALDMGNNLFEGNISAFLSPLKGLRHVDLSRNNFSGEIPEFLGNFRLEYLNLSFNRFEGKVPNQGVFLNTSIVSVMGNAKLCGGISELNLPSCSTLESKRRKKFSLKAIIATTGGIAVLFVVFLLLATYICMKRSRRRNVKQHLGLVPVGPFPRISYEDIRRATEGLNPNNLIGVGSFGSVYKGILRNGDDMVAIKVLDLRTRAASKSFMAECEALRNIRHRNLVRIFTACSTTDFRGNDFKALVYEYMKNGSLEDWLHLKVESEGLRANGRLSLTCRLSIAIDIGCAVEYLHHECETTIIHCDMKPSNVLLDDEMTAHVGDFGLARILSVDEVVSQVSSVGVRGTIGYSPPEYGMGSGVSREGDVYSYGILLLEMFTGKRPTDDMFEDAWNIRSYCEAALSKSVGEIADPSLFSYEFGEGSSVRAPRRMLECLEKVFEVGIGCCREAPEERMDIREAATKLRSIKASACRNFE